MLVFCCFALLSGFLLLFNMLSDLTRVLTGNLIKLLDRLEWFVCAVCVCTPASLCQYFIFTFAKLLFSLMYFRHTISDSADSLVIKLNSCNYRRDCSVIKLLQWLDSLTLNYFPYSDTFVTLLYFLLSWHFCAWHLKFGTLQIFVPDSFLVGAATPISETKENTWRSHP